MKMELTEKLISLVQQHPCLYDCRDKDYKYVFKKEIVWEKIAKELNQNCDSIKMKWKNIKDGYSKYKKNVKDTSGKKKTYINWIWAPYLTFLDGAVLNRSSSSKVSSDSPNAIELSSDSLVFDSVDDNMLPPNNSSLQELEDNSSQEPLSIRVPKKRKRQPSDYQDNSEVDKVLGYLRKKQKMDPIDHLFASYAKSLKLMKPRTQAAVKIKLSQIFAEAELEDLESENHSVLPVSVYSRMSASDNESKAHSQSFPEELPNSVMLPGELVKTEIL